MVVLQILLLNEAIEETTINSPGLFKIVIFVVVEEEKAKTRLSISYRAKLVTLH